MTKEELREYRWVLKNIKVLSEQIQVLESRAMSMTSTIKEDCIQASGVQDKLAVQVIDICDLQDKLNAEMARAVRVQKKIEKAIGRLPEREKLLMRLHYICGLTWEQVAVEMGYGWRQVHYMHSNTLKYFLKGDKNEKMG